jgi:GTP-binding protein LepA
MTSHAPRSHIRNFSIIAHIDHGKSTLADRFLELTHTVQKRDMQAQLLDNMDLERERGITIKSHPVTMKYRANNGEMYQLNLIDTPGHVDFGYEVSRSLSACEGALLVVDAAQGVQAQTLANVHLALDRNLEIICILNKIDLPAAEPERMKEQIRDVIGLDPDEAILCSAKTGKGVEAILEAIIDKIPCPKQPKDDILRALIFDSHYDVYRGVMIYVRVMSGTLEKGLLVKLMATGRETEVLEVGTFNPQQTPADKLLPGEVGYIIGNIKKPADVKVGDTLTLSQHPAQEPLPGFKQMQPVVFAGIYPIDSKDFTSLKEALYKLQLNDPALDIEQESSTALGFGFRCGFLGLLHLEITFERIRREFDLDILSTSPSVIYKFTLQDGSEVHIDNPARFPDPTHIAWIEEPWTKCTIVVPSDYLGAVMQLCMDRRGDLVNTENLDSKQLLLTYNLPLNEIITDFNDRLKSITKGYGSYDWEKTDYKEADIIKLEVRVHDEPVDAFSQMIHRSKAENKGRILCKKLKEEIPKHLFKIPIQAAIGGKILARETISALSKNVTAKCYGGDISRKKKLWNKQKEGKKRMQQVGKVSIPQTAYMAVLKSDED